MTLGFAAVSMAGCEGVGNESNGEISEPYTLSVDRATIEANGTDAATFTITDANGNVLTEGDYLKNTSFHIVETNSYLDRKTNTFVSIDNGTYTVEGMYLGKPCEAPVTVKVVNRSKYEVFTKKIAIYRLTATWCQYCPSMTAALEKIDDYTKSRSVVMAFHGDENFGIVESGYFLSDYLLAQFSGEGYPFAIYSLNYGSGNRTRNEIISYVWNELYEYPATSGIKATSTVNSGTVSVDASVKVSASGEYDLGCALVQNGLSGGADANEDVYNNVVRNISGNYRGMSTNAFSLDANQEKTSLKFENIKFDSANQSDCSIVLFTLVKDGKTARIDNVVSFPVGGSVDYVYNE